ncbi:MAG: serpin family protein [Phycisphaerae bacterium]|nr:serpin family protein [Phycisphaerae bacterium]
MSRNIRRPWMVLAAACSISATATVAQAGFGVAINHNNQFGLDMYRQLAKANPKGNLFFSPYSISSALAMTWEGARGKTATQMAQALNFPGHRPGTTYPHGTWKAEQMHQVFGELNKLLNKPAKHHRLSVANALWGEQTFPFRPQFLKALEKPYGAGLFPTDFLQAAEAERVRINRWVEEQTAKRIRDLLPPGSLTARTRLVLTNAIYFKADWQDKFQKRDTRDQDFVLAGGSKVKVPLMSKRDARFPLAAFRADGTPDKLGFNGPSDKQGFFALELPYKSGDLSMVVLIPHQADGLGRVERLSTQARLDDWISKLKPSDVNLWMPRFRMDTSFKLVAPLKALGMTAAFAPGEADFSGITDSAGDLHISDVVHKAFVAVDEQGTEAAAATGVVVGVTSVRMVANVRMDRPFLFLIRDKRTHSILFLGRLMNPKA